MALYDYKLLRIRQQGDASLEETPFAVQLLVSRKKHLYLIALSWQRHQVSALNACLQTLVRNYVRTQPSKSIAKAEQEFERIDKDLLYKKHEDYIHKFRINNSRFGFVQ
jgi:hypothetical protein